MIWLAAYQFQIPKWSWWSRSKPYSQRHTGPERQVEADRLDTHCVSCMTMIQKWIYNLCIFFFFFLFCHDIADISHLVTGELLWQQRYPTWLLPSQHAFCDPRVWGQVGGVPATHIQSQSRRYGGWTSGPFGGSLPIQAVYSHMAFYNILKIWVFPK